MIYFRDLERITGGTILSLAKNTAVNSLITDSRKPVFATGGIFFAIKGQHHDGHEFIKAIYEKGVRQFVIEEDKNFSASTDCNIIKVESSVSALHALVKYHRAQFNYEVIGITGSNGKTIIKEWLHQLLSPYKRVIKNPHSYNSQVGVPLSVWQMNDEHEVGIFEAGISEVGEMGKLEQIIKPSIGIFSNIGSAHDSGFTSRDEKIREKSLLFENAAVVIYCKDHEEIDQHLVKKGFTWGRHPESDVHVTDLGFLQQETIVRLDHKGDFKFIIPFSDRASVENCMHCIAYLLLKGYTADQIQNGIGKLQTVRMRLELKKAKSNSYIIDDVYNNDLAGLQIALEVLLHQNQHEQKSVIISDILQSSLPEENLYRNVNELLEAAGVSKVIGIGPTLSRYERLFNIEAYFYKSTDEFLKKHKLNTFKEEVILIKGARIFTFEKIVKVLEEKIHGTHLEINLDALTNNLNFYRSRIKPETRLMVMVKAFAYGSGILEVANLLQFHHVDYLGVAYADEGIELRRNGILLPIMVMNPSEDSLENLYNNQLEVVVYNFSVLKSLIKSLDGKPMKVHLKLDTGMHRLGFEENDFDELISLLQTNANLEVKSIFSHLAGADDPSHDDFSHKQAQRFDELSTRITTSLKVNPIRHLVNSPGMLRFPEYQFDMVRLGIGLYGLEANNLEQDKLQPVSRLKTVVSQVRTLKKGETIGYGRKGKANNSMRIATIAIGYADGFSRAFSNGVGEVYISGKRAPVVGNVCMDMTMVDITGINAAEGDEVEIFGDHLTISEAAAKINTIPYEILTNVSQRVKRVFYTA